MASTQGHGFSYKDQFVYDGMILPGIVSASNIDRVKDFEFKGDVVVSSYPKSGNTWTQEIAWLILNGGDVDGARASSSLNRVAYLEGADDPDIVRKTMDSIPILMRPAVIKTHLPARYFTQHVHRDDVKILVPIRNPKDTLVSFYHFHKAHKACQFYTGSWDEFFELFKANKLARGNLFKWYRGWLDLEKHPNVMFVKYEDMKKNLTQAVIRIASFLGKDYPHDTIEKIVSHVDFNAMKNNNMTNWNTLSSAAFDHKISPFMRLGKVGDWKKCFNKEQSDIVDEMYESEFKRRGMILEFE